jgi:hypothetical protein
MKSAPVKAAVKTAAMKTVSVKTAGAKAGAVKAGAVKAAAVKAARRGHGRDRRSQDKSKEASKGSRDEPSRPGASLDSGRGFGHRHAPRSGRAATASASVGKPDPIPYLSIYSGRAPLPSIFGKDW